MISEQVQHEQALQRLAGDRIEELGPEQERLIGVYRQRYLDRATCTQPCDRERAEQAVARLYAALGKPAPQVRWAQSPREGCEQVASLSASLGDSLSASLGDSLWDSLGASLRASLGASLVASLVASLWDSLRASLGASLWASLGASLRDSLWASLGASLGDSLSDSLGGDDGYWVAHYRYGLDVLGVRYEPDDAAQLVALDGVLAECWAVWPYEGQCFLCERPEVFAWTTDEPPKLQMARWRDGFEVVP